MSQVGFVIYAEPKDGASFVRRMVSEGDEFSLKEMQGAVKGLIERLPILPHHDLEVWVNEEGGLLDSCRTNLPFLEGFNEVLGSVLMGPKFVAGDVLVIETEGLMDHHRDGRVHKILVAKSTSEEEYARSLSSSMADECRYCQTRLTSEKSVALGVGPECANKFQPFVSCQLCQSEEHDLAKKQDRPFNWDNVIKYTHIEVVPKRLYCRKRSPDETIHGDNFGTWEDFPNCANATRGLDWDEHLYWLTWESWDDGFDNVLCAKCKEDE